MDILIEGGTVITMDAQRRVLKDGAVAIKGNSIKEVGRSKQLAGKYSASKIINAENAIVMPGLVSAHNHLFQVLFRGLGDDMALSDWLDRMIFPLSRHLNEYYCYVGAKLCSLEMIKSGTTCFSDSHYVHIDKQSIDGVARAVIEAGMRSVLGRASLDTGEVPAVFKEDIATIVKETERAIAAWNGKADGRIAVCPEALFSLFCSPELWRALCGIADEAGTGIHCHAAETLWEAQQVCRLTGRGVIEYFDFLGVLRPDLLIAHAVWITERELQILRTRDVKIAHNPVSNQYLADGFAPVPQMLKAGITVGLGADGAASNNSQDMFEAMKSCALIHKVAALDSTRITSEQVLEMATIGSAKALGLDDKIGSIEPGKRADIIVIGLDGKPNLAPNLKPVSNLVYAASGGDVDTVIIDGKIVMEARKVKTLDEAEVIAEANRVALEIIKKAGAKSLLAPTTLGPKRHARQSGHARAAWPEAQS